MEPFNLHEKQLFISSERELLSTSTIPYLFIHFTNVYFLAISPLSDLPSV